MKTVSSMLVLAVLLAVFALTLSAGYGIGKARSINFEDAGSDAQFQKYISGKVTVSRTWELQRAPNGEVLELKSISTFRFARGIFAHVYDSKSQTHHVEAAHPSEVDYSHPPRNGLSIGQVMSAFAVAVPTVGAISVPTTAVAASNLASITTANALPNYASLIDNATGSTKLKLVILGLAGIASGFYVGYKWGYRDQPKLNSKRLDDLLNKDAFWQGVAGLRSTEIQTWRFENYNDTLLAKRVGDLYFANVFREASLGLSGLGKLTATAPAANLPGLIGGVLGQGLLGTRLVGAVPGGFVVASTPPADLVIALQQAGEQELLQRLVSQAGRRLTGWRLGFPP